jgi:preprotein translocase subunit SecG
MESILLVVHVIVALLIVGLIMLQQGKGAEMGASFGAGSSQTIFGSVGSGNFFSRMTAVLVAVFFVTSFTLAILAKKSVEVDDFPIPALEKSTEVPTAPGAVINEEVPSVDEESTEVPVDAATPALDDSEVPSGKAE